MESTRALPILVGIDGSTGKVAAGVPPGKGAQHEYNVVMATARVENAGHNNIIYRSDDEGPRGCAEA